MTSQPAAGRTFYAVIIEGLLGRLGFGVVTFALPFYALSLGMSYTEVGILAALRLVAAIALKPWMGRIADRYGIRNIYVASIIGRCVVTVLFAVATTPWALFVIRFLHGVTTAARDPVSAVLISEVTPDGKVARAYAWYGSARELGAALGFLVAGVMLAATHDFYPAVFLFAGAISVVALLAVMFMVPRADSRGGLKTDSASLPTSAQERAAWQEVALVGLLLAASGSMITQLFPVLAVEYADLSKAQAGVLYAIATAVSVIAGPFLGWMADTVSHGLVLTLRGAANIVSTLLYALFPGFFGFLAGRVVDETGKAAFRAAWGQLLADAAQRGNRLRRTQRVAHLDTAQSMGEAAGPVLAGWLWDTVGVVGLFSARIVLGITAEVVGARWVRRRS